MIYFLDTADTQAIARAVDLYPLSGVTTNPTIIAKENKPLKDILMEIREIIGPDRLLHVQVAGKTADVMVKEAKLLLEKIDKNLCIKVPVTREGMKAIRLLAEEGVRITATAILTPQQALMAAVAGAEFLAPYVNRLDNICGDGVQVVRDIADLLAIHDLDAKLLAASFKNVQQVHDVALAGCQTVTIAPDVFEQLLVHPLTDSGVAGFHRDWESVYGEGKTVLDLL